MDLAFTDREVATSAANILAQSRMSGARFMAAQLLAVCAVDPALTAALRTDSDDSVRLLANVHAPGERSVTGTQ